MRAYGMPLRVVAVAATTALVGIGSVMPAVAADSDIAVVNTETVQVYTSPTGEVDEQRIYEQLSFTGNGTVDVANPVSVDGLRNLDGFGGFEVDEGNQIAQVEVDGEERLRTVSDFNGDLPLTVSIQYYLDDELVEPSDIVGESGELEVKYTVKNVTGVDQDVSFDDGKGGTVTKTVAVPIPMVGSLSTIVPSNFTDVKSDQANMAGDGRGATKMSFTMTLFPPIGSDTAEFGYTANISDGVVPPATISALPVNPLESPSFAAAGESYQGGAATGIELADGASQIDANLLKLRDGAGELLAGLIKLRDGAQELEAGLAGEASPGANLLADGADELNSGLGLINSGSLRLAEGTGEAAAGGVKLSDGAGQLSDGVGELSDGSDQLDAGATKLASGQAALEGGLTTLYKAVDALPASVKAQLKTNQDYQTLLASLQSISDGVGARADSPAAGTLLGGINAIQYAMRYPSANDCSVALSGGTPARCGAMDAVQLVSSQLSTGATDLNQLKPLLAALYVSPTLGVVGAPCPGASTGSYAPPPVPPTNGCQFVATVYYGLFGVSPAPAGAQAKVLVAAGALASVYQGVDAGLLASGAGLDRLRAGLSNGDPAQCLAAKGTATSADDCGIKEGALFLKLYGIPMLVDALATSISNQILAGLGKPTAGCDPEATLRCAAAALADGGSELSLGMGGLVDGVAQLRAGGDALSAGAGELSAGLGELDDGANQLADGTSEAADGSGQVADGANKLADGLHAAADGSGQLAGGLEKAADGAPALEDGAQRLSDEGTSKLVEAGKSTAQTYGELYAVIEAGAERADAEKMAFGAPEGAMGLTAYTYEIRGDDGESGRNIARGLGGLALLTAGAGAFALRRRMI